MEKNAFSFCRSKDANNPIRYKSKRVKIIRATRGNYSFCTRDTFAAAVLHEKEENSLYSKRFCVQNFLFFFFNFHICNVKMCLLLSQFFFFFIIYPSAKSTQLDFFYRMIYLFTPFSWRRVVSLNFLAQNFYPKRYVSHTLKTRYLSLPFVFSLSLSLLLTFLLFRLCFYKSSLTHR